MIYNTRNRINDTTEIQIEKETCFNAHNVVYSWNKMWSLKSLAMLKHESKTSLHVVQYK